MKEISTILKKYRHLESDGIRCALATVVGVSGSSYRRTGARMLIAETGDWVGGISGGCLEGDTLRRARAAIESGQSKSIRYDTTQDDPFQIGVGLGCNGIIDVVIKPIDYNNPANPVNILAPLPPSRKPHVVLSLVHKETDSVGLSLGDAFLLESTEDLNRIEELEAYQNQIISELEYTFSSRISRQLSLKGNQDEKFRIFLEYITPTIHLAVYGGSYDVFPLAQLAINLGWKVSVYCNPLKLHRSVPDLPVEINSKESELLVDDFTIAVLMSHDFVTDKIKLKSLLSSPVGYIGLLGPEKRFEKMRSEIEKESISLSAHDLSRIFSPVGLDTGAATPEEIAVSIIAEIRTFLSGRSGGHLKFRKLPIYGD